jgi:hypothetical protein
VGSFRRFPETFIFFRRHATFNFNHALKFVQLFSAPRGALLLITERTWYAQCLRLIFLFEVSSRIRDCAWGGGIIPVLLGL